MQTVQVNYVRRACGFRKAGGIYVTTKTSAQGAPVEYFLVDPPEPIYPEQFPSISAQGLHLVSAAWRGMPGVYDIFDWVGAEFYPWVPDFVEEARMLGTSRQSQPSLQFQLLTEDSRHFFLHKRASVPNPTLLFDERLGIGRCPQPDTHVHHMERPQQVYEMCTGMLWEAVGRTKTENRIRTISMKTSVNDKPFTYQAAAAPKEWGEDAVPNQLAIFMWLKPTCLEVIKDPLENRHEKALRLLRDLGGDVPYYLVEE